MAALLNTGLLSFYLLSLALGGVGTVLLTLRERETEGRLPSLAVVVLLAGITCFGGGGILALRLFALGSRRSLVAALLFALLGAALFGGLARTARQTAVRSVALADLPGALATVTSAIEPGQRGVIAPRHTGIPLTVIATSAQGHPLPVGTLVVVTALHATAGHAAAEVAPLSLSPQHDATAITA